LDEQQEDRTMTRSTQSEPPGPQDDEAVPLPLEERTRTELFALAQRLEIPGHAEMSKAELVEAIRRR
jgi:hypothetical protein